MSADLNEHGRALTAWLRKLRERAGLSQEAAGLAMDGSRFQLSRIENGRVPGHDELLAMLALYEVTADEHSSSVRMWELAWEPGRVRRNAAARQAGHESHHFRKRVEPKLIEKIAWELLADAERFTRSAVIAPRLAPATGRQPVQADPFAWEVAEHEEQLNRLWSAIYAARAELLAVERLISLQADRMDILRTAVTAAWRWASVRAEAISYTTAFAPDLQSSVDELVALAGWTPVLTPAQASRLTEAATGGASREQFVAALHSETGLGNAWTHGFLARPASPERTTSDEQSGQVS